MNKSFIKRAALVFLLLFSLSGIFAQDRNARFSLQGKPFLYIFSYFVGGAMAAANAYFLPIDFEFYYKLSDSINLFVNPNVWLLGNFEGDNFAVTFNLIGGVVLRPGATGLRGFYCMFDGIAGFSKYKGVTQTYESPLIIDDNAVLRYSPSDPNYPGTYTETIIDFFTLNIGYMIEAGYTWIFGNGFTLTLGGGFVKVFPIPMGEYEGVSMPPIGFYLYGVPNPLPAEMRMRVSLGYSF